MSVCMQAISNIFTLQTTFQHDHAAWVKTARRNTLRGSCSVNVYLLFTLQELEVVKTNLATYGMQKVAEIL